jgi:hypothetical protein
MRTSTRARFLYLVKREREGSGSAHAREEWKRGKWAPARRATEGARAGILDGGT